MPELTSEHRAFLAAHAVDPDLAEKLGVRSIVDQADAADLPDPWPNFNRVPYIAFPWTSPSGRTEWQMKADEPGLDDQGRPKKYMFRSKKMGYEPVLWAVRPLENPARVLIVEGTKQCLVAAKYAPEGVAVYGIGGCRMWSSEGLPIPDLAVAEDREVVVLLDADASSNPEVYDAGVKLGGALMDEGASKVSFAQITGAGEKDGLDDVLATRDEARRASFLARIIERAQGKPAPARPRAKKKAPAAPPQAGDGRAVVVTNQDRLQVMNELTKAMTAKFSGSELFNHGGVISRLEGRSMVPLDRGTFNGVAAEAALMVADNGDGEYVPGWADENSMKAVLARAGEFAPLEQIRRCPFVRPDGSICQEPGYDEASRTILSVEGGLGGLDVPEKPTAEDVAAARELILTEWLGDMPFPTVADRANALALLLTPFVRGHFDQVPLAVIDGLQMGVGKNKLADCIAILATGEATSPLNFVEDEAEQRKQITSAFRTGSEMFVFDEAHTIGGRSLAQALTAKTWQDRILGVSTMAEFPNRVTWLSMGNQVQVRGDLTRRVYRIALWPGYANPQNRAAHTFRHPGVSGLELEDWTRANRAALVRAVLVLVRAWFAAGEPSPSRSLTFGSFIGWERVVGGIIERAEVPGFLGNLNAWREEANEESQFVISHLAWLHETFGEEQFRTSDVRMKALTDPAGYHALLGLEDATDKKYTVELGKAYGRMKERIQGGFRLTRRGGHAKTVVWTVTREVSEVSEVSPCASIFLNVDTRLSEAAPEKALREYKGDEAGGHPSDTSDTSASAAPVRPAPVPASVVDRCPDEDGHDPDWSCRTCGRTA